MGACLPCVVEVVGGTVVVNAYDVVEAISVLMVVFSPFIEGIEVLVSNFDVSVVLMVEVLVGSIVIVSDTDAAGDVGSVNVVFAWVISVVMSSVDSIDVIVCDALIMEVRVSVVVDVVSALTTRKRRNGNINSRYAILYLPKGIIELLFVACEHIYIHLYHIQIGTVLFSEIM